MDQATKNTSDLEKSRHSLAHILAMAVIRLYPETKIGIGPAIENGFYYEVDTGKKLGFKDLEKIEIEMKKIIAEALPFKQFFSPKDQAFDTLLQSGQIYKSELLQQIPDEQVSFFRTGEFFDLCRGPHVENTSLVDPFKLTKISTTNWLGEKSRPKLQKIEGVSFATENELNEFLALQKELALRDYKKISKAMHLMAFSEEAGTEFITWLPLGTTTKEVLTEYIFDILQLQGYKRIQTPEISKFTLYRDYFEDESLKKTYLPSIKNNDQEFLLRKNAFYHHGLVFKSSKRSYKSLPAKFSELIDSYYLQEKHGNFNIEHKEGIQTHCYLNEDQVISEVENSLLLLEKIYGNLNVSGIQIQARIPDPKDDTHTAEQARTAVTFLQKALANMKKIAKVSTENICKEGAELSFIIKDIHGINFEIASLKVDTISGVKDKLIYTNKSNQNRFPVILQLSVISSFENLFKILLEQNLGAFPIWLAPIQVIVIAISEKYNHSAQEVFNLLKKEGIRAEINIKDSPMQAKIRSAEQNAIPYMLIVGEKEIRTNSVSIRQRNGQELGLIRIEEFIDRLDADLFPKIA